MKDHVKEMLVASRNDPVEEVVLINLLCRLGVSYHFENEIEERLNHIFEMQPDVLAAEKDCDLYTTAILFRVFRQHGFKVSSGKYLLHTCRGGTMVNKIIIMDLLKVLLIYSSSPLIDYFYVLAT